MSKKNKYLASFAILCIILAFALSGTTYFWWHKIPANSSNETKNIIIEKGSSFYKVVNQLHNKGIVSNPRIFFYLSRIINADKLVIKSGEYKFEKNITAQKILEKLVTGEVHFRKLTFAEGLSTYSIIKIINETEGLSGEIDKSIIPPEGYLLPETYLYSYGDTKESIVKRMKYATHKILDELWETRDEGLPFKNKQEALTLASIVEKETGISEERKTVASVFINRLNKGIKLQSDPTTIYAFAKGNTELEREIRQSDLKRNSPYNTYYVYGLPLMPISNPGYASIEAVLHPAKTDYLYFVATGNGGHNFSKSLKEHNNYVKEYRKKIKNNY